MTISSLISSVFSGNFVRKALLFVLVSNTSNGFCFEQAPDISYDSPKTYALNAAIIPFLSPQNNGGTVPHNKYGEVSTFAGSGIAGSTNGTGTAATFNAPQSITTDATGNMYVPEYYNKVIRKITTTGTTTIFAGQLNSPGNTDGAISSARLTGPTATVFDSQGNMFVADYMGNTIRKISIAGQVSTFAGSATAGLADGNGTAAQFNQPHGLAIDAADNIYVADLQNHAIRKITPAGAVTTLAGNGSNGNVNGTGAAARFTLPGYLTLDVLGNIYVADGGNNSIRKITPAGAVTTIAGLGGPATINNIGTPGGLKFGRNGNLYVTILSRHQILEITPTGVSTIIAGSSAGALGAANGAGANATFKRPQDLTFGIDGNLYIADQDNNLIRQLNRTGYTIDKPLPAGINFDSASGIFSGTPTVASPATAYTVTAYNAAGSSSTVANIKVTGTTPAPVSPAVIEYDSPQTYDPNVPISPLIPKFFGGDEVPATIYGQVSTFAAGTSFTAPQALTKDADGNIYVLEPAKNVIWKITPNGTVSLFAGRPGVLGNLDGAFGTATFTSPAAAVFDSHGNMFVSDNGSNLIRKIAADGTVSTFAGDGMAQWVNGTGTAASFNKPFGLAIDDSDYIYVADQGNHIIRKITPAGIVTTFSGIGIQGQADGNGLASARFNSPKYITIDGLNNLYVTGTLNNTIRKVSFNGTVSTIAGTAAGVPPALQNIAPSGITATPNGDLFFSDFAKHQILKLTAGGNLVVIAGTGSAGPVNNGIGTAAAFSKPQDVRFDNDGNLYVADQDNNLIRKIVLTGYTIDKAPPTGIVFDQTTGVFSGMPTAPSPPTTYTVIAYNAGGASAPATVNITVNPPPFPGKPNISYTTPQIYSVGTAIPQLRPTNTGGLVPEQVYGDKSTIATGLGYGITVAADIFGNVYVSEWGNGRVKKVSVTPNEITAGPPGSGVGYLDGPAATALFQNPNGLATDSKGNIYVADEANNRIRKISGSVPHVVTTLAGNGTTTLQDGYGINASFKEPNGLAIDPSDNFIYVADRGHSVIRKIDLQTDEVTTVNVNGLDRPSGVDIDAQGNLYIVDTGHDAIKKVSTIGLVTTLASGLNNPREVRVDGTGNIYFTDQLNNAVKKIAYDGTPTTILSGIIQPKGLSLDRRGNLYIAGINDKEIIKMSVSGYVIDNKPLPPGLTFDPKTGAFSGTPTATFPATTYSIIAYNGAGNSNTTNVTIEVIAGPVTPTAGARPDIHYPIPPVFTVNEKIADLILTNNGGPIAPNPVLYGQTRTILNNGLINVAGVTIDPDGFIYLAERGRNQIKKINPATGQVLKTYGTSDPGTNNGPLATATFNNPCGVVLDVAGNIYVSEYSTNLIRKIDITTNEVSTFASAFNNPKGMAIDATGNIYVADEGSNSIKKITSAGLVTTVVTGLNLPSDVALDKAGNLYIANTGVDNNNGSIKMLAANGTLTTLKDGLTTPRVIEVDQLGDNVYVNSFIRITKSGDVSNIGNFNPIGTTIGTPGVLYYTESGPGNLANGTLKQMNLIGYTIDLPLPDGLSFDNLTGKISGTPIVSTNGVTFQYVITAYNEFGSSSVPLAIKINNTALTPQTITMPATSSKVVCDAPFAAGATSTNSTLPITYSGDSPGVADVDASTGVITLKGVAGTVNITAKQLGNATYADATPKILQLIVTPPIKPIVTITDNRTNTCIGEPITFVANVANLGVMVTPTYQWLRNGSQVGTDPTYTVAAAVTDEIKCIVTNSLCTTAGENTITSLTQKAKEPLTLSIETSAATAVCTGTDVTFTAKSNIESNQTHYQWQVNGVNAGGDSPTFTSSTFKDGDEVSCSTIVPTAACVINYTATAASKTVHITPLDDPAPTVTITPSTDKAYAETPVTVTARVLNGTINISYQWQVNGVNAGTNSAIFTSTTFKNADEVTCTVITGNCAVPAISNAVILNILPPLVVVPPNAFTPNGDGVNDVWLISGLGTFPNCVVNVYNRLGESVYQSKGYSLPWDGLYKAKTLPFGTYYYVIDLANGKPKVTGYITIVR
jgi:gliding motility-associated-like protein